MLNVKSMMNYCKEYKKGVTLSEIMIAFFILCSCVLGIAGMISFGHRGMRKDFRYGESIQLLSDRMNKLAGLQFKELKKLVDTNSGLYSDDIINTAGEVIVDLGEVNGLNNSNKYNITADLRYQSITFSGLMQLKFNLSEGRVYSPNNLYTWEFETRKKQGTNTIESSQTFDNSVIRICVEVKPIGDGQNEKTASAITYVTDMDD